MHLPLSWLCLTFLILHCSAANVKADTCQHPGPRKSSVLAGRWWRQLFLLLLDTQESTWLVSPAQLGDLISLRSIGGLQEESIHFNVRKSFFTIEQILISLNIREQGFEYFPGGQIMYYRFHSRNHMNEHQFNCPTPRDIILLSLFETRWLPKKYFNIGSILELGW